ncbi:hypothetical protein ACIRPQ_32940 [Streptomyces sp. NPDC101213]|uniref:hypothetical protein n=1 Tax=Streptomyces sp. NPDC101213 TaxID=3366130 RepID=UPI00380113FD
MTDRWELSPVPRSHTPHQRDRPAEDVRHVIGSPATACRLDDPDLFTRSVGRTTGILTARGVPVGSLRLGPTVLAAHPYDFPRARRFPNETTPGPDSFATVLSATGTGTPA